MNIIKRFNEYNSDYRGFNTIGEFIESHMEDDYIKTLVAYYNQKMQKEHKLQYDVRVANTINILKDIDAQYLYKKVCDYLDGVEEPKNPGMVDLPNEVDSTEEVNEAALVAGKNIFKSFLRMLAALGLKENKPDWSNTPKDFLVYYQFDGLSYEQIKMMMNRFKSLTPFVERLVQNNDQKLYFGVKLDLNFEYGIYVEDHQYIGKFKMTKSNYNWLLTQETSASSSLKRELVDLSVEKMKLFSTIKKDMETFKPGKFKQKLVPTIKDDVIVFSYHGIGRWNSGDLEAEDLETLKQNFKKWAAGYKWSYKAKMNVTATDFWIKYQIKLSL